MKRHIKRIASLSLAVLIFAGCISGSVYAQKAPQAEEAAGIDYVLGRKMTEDEIKAQKAYEPYHLWPMQQGGFKIPKVIGGDSPDDLERVGKEELPQAFDAREEGFVTSVKDQNPWGLCWAFSLISCAESSLISKDLATDKVDLSEQHLGFFSYHPTPDPMGNTDGDAVVLDPSLAYMNIGGNADMAVITLSNWMGFADESTAPFSNEEEYPEDLAADLAYQDTVHLRNAYWVSASDRQEVKSLLKKYKSAQIGFYYDDSYFNYDTAAYFCRERQVNHAVAVVGWDDAYSKDNFNEECRPSKDGAWLVKNSWSGNWGDDGYFWLSYEDRSLDDFVFIDADTTEAYDHNYHYDGSVGTVGLQVYGDFGLAAVYQADGRETGAELLKSVGCMVMGTNVPYSVQIYKDIEDTENPESGIPVFETPQTGILPYSGYHTIPLKKAVPLMEGTSFSVVIKLQKAFNEFIGCQQDISYTQGDIRYVTREKSGQTMLYLNGKWIDTASEGRPWTPRMKAFTSDTEPVPVSAVSLGTSAVFFKCGEKKQLKAEFTPSDATDTRMVWSSSDSSVVRVDKRGMAYALSPGECDVTVRTANNKSDTCHIQVEYFDLSESVINLQKDSYVYDGTAKKPVVTVYQDKEKLTEGKDYTVSYSSNINAGEALVTITGKGIYIGSQTRRFRIIKADRQISGPIGVTATNTGKTWSYKIGASCGEAKLSYISNHKLVKVDSEGTIKANKKFIGDAVITIRAAASANYNEAVGTFSVRMNPYGSQILELKRAVGGKCLVRWRKSPSVGGYEIQFSTNKKFTGSGVKEKIFKKAASKGKKVSGLKKGKTYYVRIRTYKKDSGIWYYSDWSGRKKVKM